ncbi:MAG: hypothetical protein U9O98_09600 [Asgard group archaeon]|nr:hypothetical protein [Asgard group archaeon]
MSKTIDDLIVHRQDGLKLCKICQTIVEDEVEHMRLRHPKYIKYLENKEQKKDDLYMCCYCGRWVKDWKKHVREEHPEIIKDAARRAKPEPEEEELEFDF